MGLSVYPGSGHAATSQKSKVKPGTDENTPPGRRLTTGWMRMWLGQSYHIPGLGGSALSWSHREGAMLRLGGKWFKCEATVRTRLSSQAIWHCSLCEVWCLQCLSSQMCSGDSENVIS